MFQIDTERLVIRPWSDSDRAALRAIMGDPEVRRYVHEGDFTDADVEQALARHARNLASDQVCMGAVVEKRSGRIVGVAGAQPLGTTGDLEIGWVFERAVWGLGYATEAGAAAMRHVLEVLRRPRVVAIIHPENAASKRVAARLGMMLEGRYTGEQLGHRKPEIVVDLYARNTPAE